MQRALYALLALLTLLPATLLPAPAQNTVDRSAEPTPTPTVEGHAGQAPAGQEKDQSRDPAENATTLVVPSDETVDNVVVRDRTLVLAGHVRHDVMAVNSDVTVKPGATVGNVIDVVGGSVDNQAGDAVHIVRQDSGVVSLLDGAPVIAAVQNSAVRSSHDAPAQREGSWASGQFALLLLGLLIGLVMHVATPTASRQTSDVVGADRGRSLALGLIGVVLMIPALLVGGVVLHSPVGLFLSPFIAGFALLCAGLLAYGWLCGMAEVGFLLQRKIGVRQGSWFAQIAFGLGSFFLANLILGGVWHLLGVCGLLLESGVALMGLGAILISGFGADPNWLSARLHGEIPWMARTPRI